MNEPRELRVLVADDSADDAALVERFLKRSGYAVSLCRVSTLAAIEHELRAGTWQVLICDYQFHDFTADAVLALAKRLGTDIPILIVSGTIGEETASDVMRAGARDFIRKSNLARLPAAIERELDDSQARLERSRAMSARETAEYEAREARRLQQLVINSVPIVLYAVDADGVFTLCEGRGLDAIGLKAGEVVGRRVLDLYGDIDGVPDHLRRVLAGEKHEVDMTLKETKFHLVSSPIQDPAGAITGMTGVAIDITERSRKDEQLRATINELAELADERRRLLRHLVMAQEQERKRIAADLHDDTIQVITAVGIRVGTVHRKLAGTPYADVLQRLEVEIANAVKRTRRMLFDLHPRSLESSGLHEALEEYLGQVTADDGMETKLHGSLSEEPPLETRMVLYRVTVEAVTNVRKHAKAKNVNVSISSVKRGVLVKVEDDGVGFNPDIVKSEPGHLGLTAMRERVRLGHGWLRVESAPQEGTSVEFWMPVSSNNDHAAA